jgi:hypothetical protein
VTEAPEGADAGRDLVVKAVVAQVESAQEGEAANGRGDGAGEPLGTEVQAYHPPGLHRCCLPQVTPSQLQ